ncbi:hypothetical protein Pmani_030321 [Petrolisthes manimaculis]|uniref:Uncharacterized protein n=1 Tax=Petrolisthes manimaculis TaxID=1843537 RepID=A0AAE1TW12_9EUCA|nr:hypothetical protein Pmani_030321 [Petrolisthes manimaculis]
MSEQEYLVALYLEGRRPSANLHHMQQLNKKLANHFTSGTANPSCCSLQSSYTFKDNSNFLSNPTPNSQTLY